MVDVYHWAAGLNECLSSGLTNHDHIATMDRLLVLEEPHTQLVVAYISATVSRMISAEAVDSQSSRQPEVHTHHIVDNHTCTSLLEI